MDNMVSQVNLEFLCKHTVGFQQKAHGLCLSVVRVKLAVKPQRTKQYTIDKIGVSGAIDLVTKKQ